MSPTPEQDHAGTRADAVRAAGRAIGVSSIASREAASCSVTTREMMMVIFRVWIAAPTTILRDPVAFMAMVKEDFALLKEGAREGAEAEYDRRVLAHEADPASPKPNCSKSIARKNGSNGVRQLRRACENLGETVEDAFEVAFDALRLRGPDEPRLSFAQICDVFALLKQERCAASRMKVRAGLDARGFYHPLGDDYAEKYTVIPRGGKEFLTLTDDGNEIEVEVVRITSGKLYKISEKLATDARYGLKKANAFMRQAEDAQTYERHEIPTVAIRRNE